MKEITTVCSIGGLGWTDFEGGEPTITLARAAMGVRSSKSTVAGYGSGTFRHRNETVNAVGRQSMLSSTGLTERQRSQ
jgi:hypothetical protein